VEKRESKIILNGMPLDAENKIEYSLRHGLVRDKYSWRGV